MKLWIVVDHDRWGKSTNVVRAASEEEAIKFVCPGSRRERVDVEELGDGDGILWCEDESPDTPWED